MAPWAARPMPRTREGGQGRPDPLPGLCTPQCCPGPQRGTKLVTSPLLLQISVAKCLPSLAGPRQPPNSANKGALRPQLPKASSSANPTCVASSRNAAAACGHRSQETGPQAFPRQAPPPPVSHGSHDPMGSVMSAQVSHAHPILPLILASAASKRDPMGAGGVLLGGYVVWRPRHASRSGVEWGASRPADAPGWPGCGRQRLGGRVVRVRC